MGFYPAVALARRCDVFPALAPCMQSGIGWLGATIGGGLSAVCGVRCGAFRGRSSLEPHGPCLDVHRLASRAPRQRRRIDGARGSPDPAARSGSGAHGACGPDLGRCGPAATVTAQEQRQSLAAAVTSLGLITSRDWAEAVARHYEFELVGGEELPREPLLADRIPRASSAMWPCCRSGRPTTRSGWPWPTPATATRSRRWARRCNDGRAGDRGPRGPAAGLRALLGRGPVGAAADRRRYRRGLGGELSADVEHLIGAAQEAPVIRLVNQLLTEALRLHASDIHIETARDHLRVRYRVHGRLREAGAPPARLSAAVISRIKIMAKLDIAERRLPQDGRARLRCAAQEIDLRVATVPSMHGESGGAADARPQRRRRSICASWACAPRCRAAFDGRSTRRTASCWSPARPAAARPPRSTPALRRLNTAERKIVTIEDPIEYQHRRHHPDPGQAGRSA